MNRIDYTIAKESILTDYKYTSMILMTQEPALMPGVMHKGPPAWTAGKSPYDLYSVGERWKEKTHIHSIKYKNEQKYRILCIRLL